MQAIAETRQKNGTSKDAWAAPSLDVGDLLKLKDLFGSDPSHRCVTLTLVVCDVTPCRYERIFVNAAIREDDFNDLKNLLSVHQGMLLVRPVALLLV